MCKCFVITLKSSQKRCVFSCNLNDDNASAYLIACGSSFHKAGPATQNARLTCVSNLVLSQLTTLGKRSAESVMVNDCAVEMIDIEVQYTLRCIIRLCTGNQCNSFRTGVIESNFRVRVITLAAAC